jgi:hypothetical protein
MNMNAGRVRCIVGIGTWWAVLRRIVAAWFRVGFMMPHHELQDCGLEMIVPSLGPGQQLHMWCFWLTVLGIAYWYHTIGCFVASGRLAVTFDSIIDTVLLYLASSSLDVSQRHGRTLG